MFTLSTVGGTIDSTGFGALNLNNTGSLGFSSTEQGVGCAVQYQFAICTYCGTRGIGCAAGHGSAGLPKFVNPMFFSVIGGGQLIIVSLTNRHWVGGI